MHLNAEINVVSLIDVILLLLLIFMITAPMMTSGIDLDLPIGQVEAMETKDAVLVEIDRAGRVFVDSKEWPIEEIPARFPAYIKGKDDVTVRADSSISHGTWYGIITELGKAGVTSFNFAGQAGPVR
jgi:biopolymer transport protein TolR